MDTEPVGLEYSRTSTICGITPVDIGNDTVGSEFVEKLRNKSTLNDRSPFYLPAEGNPSLPEQQFFITGDWVSLLESLIAQRGNLSETDIYLQALSNTTDAVNPNFTTDALNAMNALYYSSAAGVDRIGVPRFFDREPGISKAIARKLLQMFPNRRIRIKEIGSGDGTRKWDTMRSFFGVKRDVEVVLTDFTEASLPDQKELDRLSTSNFKARLETYSLFSPLPFLSTEEKFEAMLATYTFDSVWLPQDVRYEKIENQWYRVKYRIKSGEVDQSRWGFNKGDVLEALRIGKANDIHGYFGRLAIERAVETVDIKKVPFGNTIAEKYGNQDRVSVNVPGGLVQKVIEAFDNQLTNEGVFIVGDVAVNDPRGYTEGRNFADDESTAGRMAKYKVEDYGLAKVILDKEGFQVDLRRISDFVAELAPQDRLEKGSNHWIMIIRRKRGLNLSKLFRRR